MLKQLSLLFFIFMASSINADAGMTDRFVVKREISGNVTKDLSVDYKSEDLRDNGRTCIDGRPVDGFKGTIIEFWADIECRYCGIVEPLTAQRDNPEWCIVLRHMPTPGEGIKKALIYEAIKVFSSHAANRFWHTLVPRADLPIPQPYQGAMIAATSEAAIDPEQLGKTLEKEAAKIIDQDLLAGQGVISMTPTYIIEGIRFSACDFKAKDLAQALSLAKKARKGDAEAKEEIIEMITRGHLNEDIL